MNLARLNLPTPLRRVATLLGESWMFSCTTVHSQACTGQSVQWINEWM